MRKIKTLIIGSLFLFGCINKGGIPKELILTNKEEIIIIRLKNDTDTLYQKIWSWRQEDIGDLPDSLFKVFYALDDCKPVNQGKQILISSSWKGGVALIDTATKRLLFYAINLPNAHSAEILPGEKLAVAVSTDKKGNYIALFDLNRSDQILFRDSLRSAHGVVWDDDRKLLWALGNDELRAYTLKNWDSPAPSLEKTQTYKIPGRGGHDLQAVPNSDDLFVTEIKYVWLFNRETKEFRRYEPIEKSEHVKSIMLDPDSKQLVYVQADSTDPHSDKIHFLNPSRTISFPNHVLYKARWIVKE